jgi:hypothetical protein
MSPPTSAQNTPLDITVPPEEPKSVIDYITCHCPGNYGAWMPGDGGTHRGLPRPGHTLGQHVEVWYAEQDAIARRAVPTQRHANAG